MVAKNPFSHFILHVSQGWESGSISGHWITVSSESSSADNSHSKSWVFCPGIFNIRKPSLVSHVPLTTFPHPDSSGAAGTSHSLAQNTFMVQKQHCPCDILPSTRLRGHIWRSAHLKFLYSTTLWDYLHRILLRHCHFFSHCITWGLKALWSPLSNTSSKIAQFI